MHIPASPRRRLAALACLAAAMTLAPPARAATNAGDLPTGPQTPFAVQRVAAFDGPWAIAFLPDGRLLVTEKAGRLHMATQGGEVHPVSGVPEVHDRGQTGLHDIAVSPDFARDALVYFSFVAPGHGGGALTLARARLEGSGPTAHLRGLQILWRQEPPGGRGHPGAHIAFAPDRQHLFLTVGERQDSDTAQDPDQARGKILRMRIDGSVPPDNPMAGAGGIRALTWSTGHRNPYGLAFAPDGRLWEHEMGPRGGDELNLIEPGQNYGWPLVSYGRHYSGLPIPDHDTRPEFHGAVLYWTPVIAPAGLVFYEGDLFPEWRGSALIGGLVAKGLVRIAMDGQGGARQVDRWSLGERIRDVAVAPDGAVWVIEDGRDGGLLRLTPKEKP
ncbi:PQQ-dependent sugar dehydrogenase [Castellaniella sp. GW247-6E4]|uniref:PQQ-dependent sugar dehydrogenase n=1 Tax=Castellaniella sp. GW247-6E4 TaxID=3140380 RepID=UPI0033151301